MKSIDYCAGNNIPLTGHIGDIKDGVAQPSNQVCSWNIAPQSQPLEVALMFQDVGIGPDSDLKVQIIFYCSFV